MDLQHHKGGLLKEVQLSHGLRKLLQSPSLLRLKADVSSTEGESNAKKVHGELLLHIHYDVCIVRHVPY